MIIEHLLRWLKPRAFEFTALPLFLNIINVHAIRDVLQPDQRSVPIIVAPILPVPSVFELHRCVLPSPFSHLPALFRYMESAGGLSLYPLHRCKTIHLVRHAQAVHNVAMEKDRSLLQSYDYFDAQLSDLGWLQVDNLGKHVQSCGISKTIELVIVSPLLRTMQTAVGAFGGDEYKDGTNVPPLMVANAGGSNHPAISSLNCPPFLAVELCRERLGVNPCDKRRSISEYRSLFPAIDFSIIEHDDDILWTPDTRESNDQIVERGLKFLDWLWTRKETEIAIVTHSAFLFELLKCFGNDCHPSIKSEISKFFTNCELRSMVLVDKSMKGSDPSRTNYPGKIPQGLDLPSDAATEKHPEKGATGNAVA